MRKPCTVLVIDDDPLQRKFIHDVFEATRFNVLEAATGEKALAIARSTKIDVFIADLILPDMDGRKLIPLLRQQFPSARILAMTAGPDLDTGTPSLWAKTVGADAALRKPVSIRKILETIRDWCLGDSP